MIRALLLATGLLSGPLHVGVAFDSPPHTVEILLDGEKVAEVAEPPWEAAFDLGDELTPRELVVISRDAAGQELDRRAHWLNVGAAPGEKARDATPIAVLLDDARPLPAELDSYFEAAGRPAEVVDVSYPGAEIWIVRDPKTQLELDRAARLAFAGEMGYSVPTEVLRDGPNAAFEYLSQEADFILRARHRFWPAWKDFLQLFAFEEGTEIRLVSPWGAPVSQIERPRQIFGATRPIEMRNRGLLHRIYATRPLTSWFRLADAAGIAGLQAARDRRRAVVVLTADPDFPDDSLYAPSEVRGLLKELGVPLFVWHIGHGDSDVVSEWGPTRPAAPSIGSAGSMVGEPGAGYLRNFEFEYFQLARTLERQRIVWISGRHLPGTVSLRPEAEGVRLVSSVESWPLLESDPTPPAATTAAEEEAP